MNKLGIRFDVAGQVQLDRFFADMILLSEDMRPAFKAIGDDWYSTEHAVFAGEGAAEGNPAWAQLSPVYAAWKAATYPGKGILVRTGGLMRSLTEKDSSEAVYDLTKDSLTMGSTVRTKSGAWNLAMLHQFGTSRMPARPVGLLTQAQRIRWSKIVETKIEAIFSQAEGAGGNVGG